MAHRDLDLRERRMIENMLNAKMSDDAAAARIGRHRSEAARAMPQTIGGMEFGHAPM